MLELLRHFRNNPVRALLLLLLTALVVRHLPQDGLTRSLLALPLSLVAAFVEGFRSWELEGPPVPVTD